MTFDSVVLASVAHELNTALQNGRVHQVHVPSPLDVVVTVRVPGADHMVLVSADAQSPRIHLTSSRRPNPKTPPNFCMLMRKYLKGARFIEARQVDFDRVVHLEFGAYDGERLSLVVEIMGKHSNAVLINSADRILGVLKPVGRSKNRYRELLPGRQYLPPPPQKKANPLEAADLSEAPSGVEEMASWLVKSFVGMSPFAARELAARSQGNPPNLEREFTRFFEAVFTCDFSPVLITDDAGRSIGFYAFPSVQHPTENQHARPSISTVADMYYSSALPRETLEHRKAEFVNRLNKELEARKNTLASIEESLEECEGAERYKQIGELILSQTAAIQAQADSATLTDYYDPDGKPVEVELDPALSAAENAETYFTRYQKAVSGAEALRDRLAETAAEVKIIEKALKSAQAISSVEQIEEFVRVLEDRGIHVRKAEQAAAEKRKAEFEGRRISRVKAGDWEILVGQNSEANDYLLNRVAKPDDLWLHVKASASAHVIIRTNGKPESVPKAILDQAAELAARNSDSKHSSLVPVDYTLRKYVRKLKGGPPGKALYQNEKTIYVTPGP